MNDPELAHLDFEWQPIGGFILSASFGAWAWVVKRFGEAHIESIKELAVELREMRKDINALSERLRVVETVQEHYTVLK